MGFAGLIKVIIAHTNDFLQAAVYMKLHTSGLSQPTLMIYSKQKFMLSAIRGTVSKSSEKVIDPSKEQANQAAAR